MVRPSAQLLERARAEVDYADECQARVRTAAAAWESTTGQPYGEIDTADSEASTTRIVQALKARGHSALANEFAQAWATLIHRSDAVEADTQTHGELQDRIANGATAAEIEHTLLLWERSETALDDFERVCFACVQVLDGSDPF